MNALITLLITAVFVAVDQGIKFWATAFLQPVGTMPLIQGVAELKYVLNEGAAFSILSGKQEFLIGFTGLALAGLLIYLLVKKPNRKLEYFSWLMVLSGGIGNFIDRVVNQEVVDYINLLFMDFAVFNFADILVCVGIALLLIDLIIDERQKAGKINQNEENSSEKA